MIKSKIQEKIINVLSIECTINDVAREAGVNRITASKYLAVMEAEGTIKHRNIGAAKLFSLCIGN